MTTREYPRSRRVAEAVKRALAPIVSGHGQAHGFGMVTLTGVEVSADLKNAVLYVSCFGAEARPEAVIGSLRQEIPSLRRALATAVKLRVVPTLSVRYDDTAEKGARLDALLNTLANEGTHKIAGE
jgi:ribosome-binding factor A